MTELRLRAAGSAYAIFAVMLGIPMAVCAAAALRQPSMWTPVAILGAALAGFELHVACLAIEIADGDLRYRSLFGGWALPIVEIERAEFQWVRVGRVVRPTLIVTRRGGAGVRALSLKPFRRNQVEALLARPELRVRTPTDAV